MNKFWIYGDSWTWSSVQTPWSKRIAEDLGFEYINKAQVGLSNQRIFFNLLSDISRFNPNDVVFLQTSYNSRFNFYNVVEHSFNSKNDVIYKDNGYWHSNLHEDILKKNGVLYDVDVISEYHNKTINTLTTAYFDRIGLLLKSMKCTPIHIPIEKWVGYYPNWERLEWNGIDNFESIVSDVIKEDGEVGDSHLKIEAHDVLYERLFNPFKEIITNYQ